MFRPVTHACPALNQKRWIASKLEAARTNGIRYVLLSQGHAEFDQSEQHPRRTKKVGTLVHYTPSSPHLSQHLMHCQHMVIHPAPQSIDCTYGMPAVCFSRGLLA